MGRKSKSTKARQNNARIATQSRRATMEEVPDEDPDGITAASSCVLSGSNHALPHPHSHPFNALCESEDCGSDSGWDFDLGNELPDLDCEHLDARGDTETDLDDEIVEAQEISDASELDTFTKFLVDAQDVARKAERARDPTRKRPKHYLGNAPQMKRRHAQKERELKSKGFLNVFDYMKKVKEDKLACAAEQTGSEMEPNAVPDAPVLGGPAPSEPDEDIESEEDEAQPTCLDPVNLAHVHLRELLESLWHGNAPFDPSPETAVDKALNQLNYKDFAAL
ncbi:hypothetical protein FB451DRAFT_1195158 [Mycena latifolia]|nr:hypothetical protein FB451DRAFT_1195158 [Mycena latifolia]